MGWLALDLDSDRRGADLAVGVAPSNRGIGVGDLLVDTALEWAGEGFDLQRLHVHLQDADLQTSLFLRFGFVEAESGQPVCDANEDAIRLVRPLPA
jgi:GNAT superfamily N-acetyltransferase